jgi:hypothetical protein
MAQTTVLKALAGYFNSGEHKVSLKEFSEEIKALSPEEKRELAEGVVAITGDTLPAA